MEQPIVIVYFVIFKPQAGQTAPAYSYVTSEHLTILQSQDAIDVSYDVYNPEYTKEEIEFYLEKYQSQVNQEKGAEDSLI